MPVSILQSHWVCQTPSSKCCIILLVVKSCHQWKPTLINVFTYFPSCQCCFCFTVGFLPNCKLMVDTVCGKYLSVCVHVTRRSPLGGKFGSVPSTLDKSAGTAPRAAKVIHCWLCSQRRHKRPVAHRVSFGSYVRV